MNIMTPKNVFLHCGIEFLRLKNENSDVEIQILDF